MPIPLPQYAKIKDRYCVSYLGSDPSIVLQLKRARPFIEKELPGLKICIACKDELIHLLEGEGNVIPASRIEEHITNFSFAYYRELERHNPDCVKMFLSESEIPFPEEIFSAVA